ncbi:MAG: response regulator [Patiriisocius sp.]|uniref:response regulator n=1 Tax=Patiriisocius sp. TaxID=2822396 RepID=UPI003EF0A285
MTNKITDIPFYKYLIILVDDDRLSNLLNKKIIDKNFPNQKVLDFIFPKKALTFILDYITEKEGLLIFLDLNMPLISGWEFLKILNKKKQYFKSFHIYILSSSINHIDKKKAMKYSFVKGFISKPLTNEEVREIQNKLLIQPLSR